MKRIAALLPLALVACMTSPPATPETPEAATYGNSTVGYTIEIPSDWTVTENDVIAVDGYEATGTSFAYPAERDGSALLEAKVHVAMVPACPAQDGGIMEPVNGTAFMRTDFDGAGAGNRYRGRTYQIERPDGRCAVATLYTRSCNLGPDCGENRQNPYSYDGTVSVLRGVLDTLTLR